MEWLWIGVLVFAGAAAVLMLVQVLALDGHFGFAGAAAVLMLVQVLALDRHWFCKCCCRADAGASSGSAIRFASCHG